MKSKMNIKSIVILAAVSLISLFFINMSFAVNTGKITVETANLRETTDEESKILEQLSMDKEVEIIEKVENWYKVKANGITGYIREDLLDVKEEANQTQNQNVSENQTTENPVSQEEPKQEETKPTETTNLDPNKRYVTENIKLKIVPLINATDIIEVKKDEEVTIIEELNDWVCIETGATKGWIRKEKLSENKTTESKPTQETTPEEPTSTPSVQTQAVNKTLYIKNASVNVRKEATTASEVVTTLTINTSVNVTEELSNGWSKVKVNDTEGYILSSLLTTEKQATSRSQTARQSNNQTTTQSTTNTSAGGDTSKAQTTTSTAPATPVAPEKGATVVETAKKYLGCKYVYGGTTPSGFDCSGFTSYVYKLHGISLSRTSQAQFKNGVAVAKNNLQPGDLVFFYKGISHVGIYIGGGNFIHASNSRTGVIISSLSSGYYSSNYAGARRVL